MIDHWQATNLAHHPAHRAGATDFTGFGSGPIGQHLDVLPFPGDFSQPFADHPLPESLPTPGHQYQEDPNAQVNIPPRDDHQLIGSWFDPGSQDGQIVDQQQNGLPRLGDSINHVVNYPLVQPFPTPDYVQPNIPPLNDHQFGGLCFGIDFEQGLMAPLYPDPGSGFQMSSPWIPQDTIPALFQGQPNMLGLGAPLPDAAFSSVPVPPASTVPQAAVNHRNLCHEGCPETFGRPEEYRRHMKIHQPPEFRCVYTSCERTFTRLDKVRDHIRQGHKRIL